MKNKLLVVLSVGILTYGGVSFAGMCSTKPEAESVKNPLPVKYKQLKAENEELKNELEACRSHKEELNSKIANLKSQISQLEAEKAQLQSRLNSLPSKESLQLQIKELENRLGR